MKAMNKTLLYHVNCVDGSVTLSLEVDGRVFAKGDDASADASMNEIYKSMPLPWEVATFKPHVIGAIVKAQRQGRERNAIAADLRADGWSDDNIEALFAIASEHERNNGWTYALTEWPE
jgi:hypothetical protein